MLVKSNSYLKTGGAEILSLARVFFFLGLMCLPMSFFTSCGTNMVLDPSASLVEGTEITGSLLVPVMSSADESAPLLGKAAVKATENTGSAGTLTILDENGNTVTVYDENGDAVTEIATQSDGTYSFTMIVTGNFYILSGTNSDGTIIWKKLVKVTDLSVAEGEEQSKQVDVSANDTIAFLSVATGLAENGICADSNIGNCIYGRALADIEFPLTAYQTLITQIAGGTITDGDADSQQMFFQVYHAARAAMTGAFGKSDDNLSSMFRGTLDATAYRNMASRGRAVADPSANAMESERIMAKLLEAAGRQTDIMSTISAGVSARPQTTVGAPAKAVSASAARFLTLFSALTKVAPDDLGALLEKQDHLFDTIREGFANNILTPDNASAVTAVVAVAELTQLGDAAKRLALINAMRNSTGDMNDIRAQALVIGRIFEAYDTDGHPPADFESLREKMASTIATFIDGSKSDRDYMDGIDRSSLVNNGLSVGSSEEFDRRFDGPFFYKDRLAGYVPPNIGDYIAYAGTCYSNLKGNCNTMTNDQACSTSYTRLNNITVNCIWAYSSCFPFPPDKPCTISSPTPPAGPERVTKYRLGGFERKPDGVILDGAQFLLTSTNPSNGSGGIFSLPLAETLPVTEFNLFSNLTNPSVLKTILPTPGVVPSDGKVIFANDGTRLFSAPNVGNGQITTIITSSTTQNFKNGFTIAGNDICWGQGNAGGKIQCINKDTVGGNDSNRTQPVINLASPRYVTYDAGPPKNLIFVRNGPNNTSIISKVPITINPITATGPVVNIATDSATTILDLVVSGAWVAWTTNDLDPNDPNQELPGTGRVVGANLDGTDTRVLATNLKSVRGLKITGTGPGTSVYAAVYGDLDNGNPPLPIGNGSIIKISTFDGGPPQTIVSNIAPLHVQYSPVANYVYYTTFDLRAGDPPGPAWSVFRVAIP